MSLCLKKHLGLAAGHQRNVFRAPLVGGIRVSRKRIVSPSKGRYAWVSPPRGFFLRRLIGRVTAAIKGNPHCGIALRCGKTGEGSGRERKASGQIRRAEAVSIWKAQPSLGMAGLSLSISSVVQTLKQNLNQTKTV